MTYKYNPFWQQRIRETVRHALNVHPRLTALRVDLRFPDVPAATDAAVISRFINGTADNVTTIIMGSSTAHTARPEDSVFPGQLRRKYANSELLYGE